MIVKLHGSTSFDEDMNLIFLILIINGGEPKWKNANTILPSATSHQVKDNCLLIHCTCSFGVANTENDSWSSRVDESYHNHKFY